MKNSFLLFIILIAACSKDSGGSNDNQAPVVTLSSPVANQQFSAGQAVAINGQLTDNQKISEVHVHISDAQAGTLLIDIHRYPAAGAYTLSESFQAQSGISYKIQVIAKDNSGNEGRTTVEISTD